jgi:hypothetical protein
VRLGSSHQSITPVHRQGLAAVFDSKAERKELSLWKNCVLKTLKNSCMKWRKDLPRKRFGIVFACLVIPAGTTFAWLGVSASKSYLTLAGVVILLAGSALVGLPLRNWFSPRSARNVFRRSMREATGTVVRTYREEREDSYGSSYKYFVTVRFKADHAKLGTRVISVKFQVPSRRWKKIKSGGTVGIRYAAEDPTIALIEGEW